MIVFFKCSDSLLTLANPPPSSCYVDLVRTLSSILHDCWLDVRELTPGDRVTEEIAHAAATTRCLVIFFAYEYLRSVNCTLEFLTALRYRSLPQNTIILIEALNEPVGTAAAPPASAKSRKLTAAEAHGVADILTRAVPGLVVVKSVEELIDALDRRCVRATTETGIRRTIAWWAKHGKARVNRVGDGVRVVPPLLHKRLQNYVGFLCTCLVRRRGDVVGGFSLIRGDGRNVHWYQPPNSATLVMIAVIFSELLVYGHMFSYCSPDIQAAIRHAGLTSFQGKCVTDSLFLYTISLLPFVLVVCQVRDVCRICHYLLPLRFLILVIVAVVFC